MPKTGTLTASEIAETADWHYRTGQPDEGERWMRKLVDLARRKHGSSSLIVDPEAGITRDGR